MATGFDSFLEDSEQKLNLLNLTKSEHVTFKNVTFTNVTVSDVSARILYYIFFILK